jgi:hypothetical protein
MTFVNKRIREIRGDSLHATDFQRAYDDPNMHIRLISLSARLILRFLEDSIAADRELAAVA